MVRVKICGMMAPEHIALCVRAGAHALGFVVDYPVDVPWNLSPQKAEELVAQVPPFVTSCMVVGGSPDRVVRLARQVRPDVVQLHYEETVEETAWIASRLREMGIRTIKALRTTPDGRLQFELPDAAQAATALSQTGIAALLVDACTPSRPGGSGKTADADIYRLVCDNTRLPIILAGGLRADNIVEEVSSRHAPYAVDVLTGAERRPGEKDPEKVAALIRAAASIQ